MIADAIFAMVSGLIDWVLSFLPDWEWGLPTIVTDLVGVMMSYDNIVPVTETLICLQLLASLIGGYALFKWVVKLWELFPFKAS